VLPGISFRGDLSGLVADKDDSPVSTCPIFGIHRTGERSAKHIMDWALISYAMSK
jgi:hypothetical protein